MDLWLIAATAATGYITKHIQNVPNGKESFLESSSQDLTNVKLESPRSLASESVRVNKPNLEDCVNAYGVEVASSNDEILSDSFKNQAFLKRNRRFTNLIKPLRCGLHREKMCMKEYMYSPFPSPCYSASRPLLVTDGTQVISKNIGDSISQQVPKCGIPKLSKLESSVLYAKRSGNAKSVSRRFDHKIGSNDAALLLCVGISIGIMSSFVVNKVKANIQEKENLKDSLKVKDDLQSGEQHCDEKTVENLESISKIEAELEAELERLEINMSSSNIETRFSDVFELEPEFEVEFAQGEMRDDRVKTQSFDETKSNKEPSGNSTPESGNYTVSARELSLRLHKVINSRYEKRVKELEIALQESQRKLKQLEGEKKPFSKLTETHQVVKYKRNSNLQDSVAHIKKKHNLADVQIQPLVMNLAGEALDAFNESYEELMDINDSSEEDDLPCEMQENKQQEELSLTSKSSSWSHKDDIQDSSRTSEDVNFFMLQDLLCLSDEEEEEEFESEMEKQLIQKIVEKTKQGSSSVFNAQKMLFLMEETEHNP